MSDKAREVVTTVNERLGITSEVHGTRVGKRENSGSDFGTRGGVFRPDQRTAQRFDTAKDAGLHDVGAKVFFHYFVDQDVA